MRLSARGSASPPDKGRIMITRRVLRAVIWLIVWAAVIALILILLIHLGGGDAGSPGGP
jgi:hypothetical protein